MPTYTFLNKSTNKIEEHNIKMSQYDNFKNENPHLERRIIDVPTCSDPVRLGLKRPAAGFRDLLKNIKSKHARSTINSDGN